MTKDEVLKIFLKKENEIVTGGYIAKQLNVSRNTVWKAVNLLKNDGYNIESIKNVGYKLKNKSDFINEILIKENLTTNIIGKKIKIFKTIDSTNTYLKENDFENGTVVISNHQSSGKGRRGKQFISNENSGIYFSFVIYENIDINKISLVTICVGVVVVRALKKICNFDASLKWINDIFYNRKKLGGILTEATLLLEEQKIEKLIIGIGLNTNNVDEKVKDIATSINDIIQCDNYKNKLISEILNTFEEIYINNLINGEMQSILDEYKEKLFFLNEKIQVIGAETYNAVALGINEKGELLIKDEDEVIKTLNSGEISIKFKEKL